MFLFILYYGILCYVVFCDAISYYIMLSYVIVIILHHLSSYHFM